MRLGLFALIFFILYCFEAGLFLVIAPWNPAWDRVVVQMPLAGLHGLLFTPTLRGAVSGFGLVHLVWGVHDLRLVLDRRRQARRRLGDGR
jgi:hypothetical protein